LEFSFYNVFFRETGLHLRTGQFKVKPFRVSYESFGSAQGSLVEQSNHEITLEK